MKPTSKRTQRDYSLAFKLAVVDQVEKGEFTYKQAQYQYGIQSRSTVLVWLRKHGRLDWSKDTSNALYKGAAMIQSSEQQTPEQLWVADITYLSTHEGDTYLSLITDAYSQKIVGYHLDDNMKTNTVKKSLLQALKKCSSATSLVHHSDRGLQYCSAEYQETHKKYNIQCSMTDGYDCYQNALAERVNGILKMEYLLVKPSNLEQARKLVEESIQLYNERRPHLSLKYKTPNEVHRAFYT